MKVLSINGSPRKSGNTAAMLKGAVSQGAETEFIHLYDIDFKGCISCLACKDKNGKSFS
jgi:multimeric flavodoxin WrbA